MDNLATIKAFGFEGFIRLHDLIDNCSLIPDSKGVYMILSVDNKPAEFLEIGTGGFFKGRNPNISLAELKNHWVDNTMVVYIGKAGADGSKATLRSRLNQYFRFGQGKNVGHYGGRLIWQLKNSGDLIVCWKPLLNDDPRRVEAELIRDFVIKNKKRPFANLTD